MALRPDQPWFSCNQAISVRQRSRAGLDAAVALVGVGCACARRRRFVEEAAHVIVQRLLVALKRQHVIGALIDNLLGDLALAAHRVGQ